MLEKIISHSFQLIDYPPNEDAHNLWSDLDVELINDRAADQFVSLLRNIDLSKNNYFEALGELISQSLAMIKQQKKSLDLEGEMIYRFFLEYQKWYEIVSPIIR